MQTPILYSFRRCPYAIRARMALAYSGINVRIREVVLKKKPEALRILSPKATVPVLQLPSGAVLDESIDIIHWALAQHDPHDWALPSQASVRDALIAQNDLAFKPLLDGYKYPQRQDPPDPTFYRKQSLPFLNTLEQRLQATPYLMGVQASMVDIALFPFIRQFSMVDIAWFEHSSYTKLIRWWKGWIEHPLFHAVMTKYPLWEGGPEPFLLDGASTP